VPQTAVATEREVGALSEDLRLACMRISRRVRFESAGEIAPHQFSVLARLERGPASPRALADVEKVSAPSMTRTVGCLADQGLVARHDDPDDGRRIIVELTDEGRAALRRTRQGRNRWMHERILELGEQDRRALAAASEVLARIAAR